MKLRLSPPKANVNPGPAFQGFNAPKDFDRPEFADTLRFPNDLTQLAPANVSELHGKYTQLFVFANREATRLSVEIMRTETQESLAKSSMFRRFPAINSQERWKRDAVMDSDPEIENTRRQISSLRQEQETAKCFASNYTAYIAALSRELSRRMQEQGVSRA
jgi:hypothetical protein